MRHLVDVDDDALSEARATLGTVTIKDTVNTALRIAAANATREQHVGASIRALAKMRLTDADRQEAWR